MKQKTTQLRSQAAPSQTNESSKTQKKSTPPVTSFSDHVGELRKRTFFVAFVFLLASGLAYNYHDFFVGLIMKPLGAEKLIYLTPGGGFNFIFQVSLYAGLLAAAPILIYQLYGFIKPALPQRARRSASTVVSAAFLLMICGVSYGYCVAVPSALNFLSTFAGADITPNLTADSYLSFFLAYIAGLGVLFELPLLLLFFHWIHPMTPGRLLKSERFIVLFAFIIAALITPTPDIFNQSMIALPLIVIYQCGVMAVLVAIRKERRTQKRSEAHVTRHPIVAHSQITPLVANITTIKARPSEARAQTASPPVQANEQPPLRRSIDGFGTFSRQHVIVPRRPVEQMQPQRPQPTMAKPRFSGRFSMDGFISS